MGPGMAATFARYGYRHLSLRHQGRAAREGQGTIDFVFKTLVGGEFLTADEAAEAAQAHHPHHQSGQGCGQRRLRGRDRARATGDQEGRLHRAGQASQARHHPRLQHLWHPHHHPAGRTGRPEPYRRHALVESAPPDPGDRGHQGRANRQRDRRNDQGDHRQNRHGGRYRRQGRARLRGEPHPLRDHARGAAPPGRRASPRRRTSTPSPSGGSATSWPSSVHWNCSMSPGSISTPPSPAT